MTGTGVTDESSVEVTLSLEEGYRFGVRFEPQGEPRLVMDEPPPLGEGAGPNAARVLAAAVGDCLSASLLFCLRKARVDVQGMGTVARASLVRNERGRLRVGGIRVSIRPRIAGDRSRLGRCVKLFEDFCVVTDSVRQGLPVVVDIEPAETRDGPIPAKRGLTEEPVGGGLPRVSRVLAVCAHPDDESFGLGAVLDALVRAGSKVSVLSLTQGERGWPVGGSTGDPAAVRSAELTSAAQALALERAQVLTYPDGNLAAVPLDQLTGKVGEAAAVTAAELLLVFDDEGITGHPDHQRATQAALGAARQASLPVLAWALPREVAEALNEEYGTAFVGRAATSLQVKIDVDRSRQWKAISRHTSQAAQFPLVARRLELLGNREYLRWLLRSDPG
ncbi:MAG TPA: PIG-L family deacetylase [Actinomycetes bacterium]|nr:PIG-L family deacetylase [Actinomycetes bacterium]